ncbi:hypothetical protein Tco_0492523 [Tanacetum coccineum]
MLNKDHTRQSKTEKLSVSSNALRILPTRVKDNTNRLCLYLQMPEVLEDDLKEHYIARKEFAYKRMC